MKAVLMAGGEGTRLRPMTSNLPKPLVPVANKTIMEHTLQQLRKCGITEIVCTLFYMADEIQTTFGTGIDYDVDLTYSVEDSPLGTAGSVKKAAEHLGDETFLVVSGDALTDIDFRKVLAYHKEKGAAATLVLKNVPNPLDFGLVICDQDGRVQRFAEKPSWSEVFSDTVNTGIFVLEPEILGMMEPDTKYDWSADIFPLLLDQGKPVYGYIAEEYWCDVGSFAQYREAQEDVLTGRTNLTPEGELTSPGTWIGQNAVIDPETLLVPPVCIGRNAKIRKGARIGPYTVIGDNTFIEENAVVERSVVWDNAYIGPNVKINSAVLCSRTTVKRDSVVNEDAVVGERCLIDVGTTIRPRVKLWPDKIVERGSTVTMSLVWGNKWRGNIFRELGAAGLSNIEITPDFACRLGSAYGSCLPKGAKVVASRDSTRSSRMIKRAFIASLLGVGCDVLDLRAIPAPVARHYIRRSKSTGAVHVRKLPGNARVTLIELFDERGSYLSPTLERKVETTFFREDFARIDPDDLGVLDVGLGAAEGYQADYLSQLGPPLRGKKRLKVVSDFGYSAYSTFMPLMLAKMGVEALSLNTYVDAKLAPRIRQDIDAHTQNVQNIVASVGSDLGFLLTDEGERLTVVDDRGQVLSGNKLFAVMCMLVAKTDPDATFGMSVTAPRRLEQTLLAMGRTVLRTKADTRSLMKASLDSGVTFAGDERGGFIFPKFHPGFDAAFTFGKLITMLQATGLKLSEVSEEVPSFQLAYEQVRCPWESKGAVMRQISEESAEHEVDLLDGIKIYDADRWVLILPDAVEPTFHVYAESPELRESTTMVQQFVRKIETLQGR